MEEKEKEKLAFKKRYVLNRLIDVLNEVKMPGYAVLEVLSNLTAKVIIEGNNEIGLDERMECSKEFAKMVEVSVFSLSNGYLAFSEY